MTFTVNYSNEIWWAQLWSVDSTPYRGVGKRMIMVLWLRLHRKFLLLQWLHNTYWNCKDNKSNIIDCNTVLECFCKHQSHLQWTAANAYDAGQTEMDSPQQTNYTVVFGAAKVNGTRTIVHLVQIQINKKNTNDENQSHHLMRQICQKLNSRTSFTIYQHLNEQQRRKDIWSFLFNVINK